MPFLAPVAGALASTALGGGTLGTIAGGLASTAVGQLGARRGQAQLQAGAGRAAEAARFRPFNISTSIGQTGMRDGNMFATLSPQLQAAQNALFGGAGQAFGQWKGFDPYAAGAEAYGRLKTLAAPGEAQARSQQENRLFAQGRLGTTGGAQQFGQLLSQQNMADLARQQQALEFGQQLQANILQQGLGALQGGYGLQAGLMDQLRLGTTAGAQQSAANQWGAAQQLAAAQNQAANTANFWSQLSGPIGGLVERALWRPNEQIYGGGQGVPI